MAAPMTLNMDNVFVREYEKNNGDALKINQLEVGDVGCVVWDAALVLSKYLETNDFDYGRRFEGKSVIELGSGTGIVGIVAGTFGASVTITDLPEFVPLMQMNIEANKQLINGVSTEPLVNTIEKLCTKNTQVLCCYEHRSSEQKIKLQTNFFKLMSNKFTKEVIPLEQQDEHFRSDDIHIFKFCLR